MPGAKSIYFDECINDSFIGVDFDFKKDLSKYQNSSFRTFSNENRPIYLKKNPGKTKVSAGLACGSVWTICFGLEKGDFILCPDGKGEYHVGEIISNYYFAQNESVLPHRRKVDWKTSIKRSEMSQPLQNSSGSILTTCDLTKYSDELNLLINDGGLNNIQSNDPTIESVSEFALEKHLEDFLIKNWKSTGLGKKYDVYEVDGEVVGQQYPSDTGPIDVLAISKNRKTLLVVELKKGRVSDSVVGQIQRYMGFVKEELAEKNQDVKGIIIGFDDDVRLQRALSVTSNIEFYKYEVNFKLTKR